MTVMELDFFGKENVFAKSDRSRCSSPAPLHMISVLSDIAISSTLQLERNPDTSSNSTTSLAVCLDKPTRLSNYQVSEKGKQLGNNVQGLFVDVCPKKFHMRNDIKIERMNEIVVWECWCATILKP